MVVAYNSTKLEVEESEKFWNDVDRVVDRIGNGYILYLLGYLDRWIGDMLKADITGRV